MSKILYKYVFLYYFALTACFGLLDMFSIHLFEYSYIIILALIVCSFKYFKTNVVDGFDYLMIFTILLISFLGYVKNPYKDLYKLGLLWEILPMLAFFIGKDKNNKNGDLVLKNGIVAVMITGAIGLALYILQPGWYLNYKLSVLTDVTDFMWLEMTRLSAFWQYPYWMSYGVALIYIFILGKFVIDGQYKNKVMIFTLFFLFLISILTQQRASIGGILMATIVYVIIYKGLSKKQILSVLLYSFIIIIILYATFYLLSSFLDLSRLDFILSKYEVFENSKNNFLSDRAEIFDYMKDIPKTMFGDGLGLYSHGADSKGLKHYITDQGYMKMLYETGYLGLVLRMYLILCCLLKAIHNFRNCHVECLVIIVFLVSLFGANSLSALQMHNIVFWFCCGHIWKKVKIKYKY